MSHDKVQGPAVNKLFQNTEVSRKDFHELLIVFRAEELCFSYVAINGLLRDDLREVTAVLLLEVVHSALELQKTSPKSVLNRVYLCASFLLVENRLL